MNERPAPLLTPARLRRSAEHYLSRYAPNTSQLRATLDRKLRRADPASDLPALRAEIEAIVAWAVAQRLVDDAAWAESRARRLIRRGVAPGVVKQRLRAHGLDADAALATVEDPTMSAAWALCRRRRLGPYRPAEERAANRKDDLAKLGRAGFSWAVAVKVIDAPDPPR